LIFQSSNFLVPLFLELETLAQVFHVRHR